MPKKQYKSEIITGKPFKTINPETTHGFLLDGVNEFIRLNYSPDFTDGVNDLPFSFVIKAKFNSFSVPNYLISKMGQFSSSIGSAYHMATNPTTGQLRLVLSENIFNNGRYTVITSSGLTTGVEYHLVFTYDGLASPTSFAAYIDGVSQSFSTINNNSYGGMSMQATNVTLGARGFSYGQYMNGVIYSMAMYDRVITSSEAKALANGANPTTITNNIYYTTLADLAIFSGNFIGKDLSWNRMAQWNSENMEIGDKIIR